MKKIFLFFIFGQLVLFSILFTRSIYDIYGLTHIGDSSLTGYQVEEPTADSLGQLYDQLENKSATIQIIKMPMDKTNSDIITYAVYHSDINSISKFISVSHNQYKYYSLTKEDFESGTGVFYTDLSKSNLNTICNTIGISIKSYQSDTDLSMKDIFITNGIDCSILFFISFGVMVIYIISKNKENAVKKLLGYSSKKIVLKRITEILCYEIIFMLFISLGHLIYVLTLKKFSLFYFIFLLLFLGITVLINVVFLFVSSLILNRINIVSGIKNKVYSNKLDSLIQIVKVLLLLGVTILISTVITYNNQINAINKKMDEYKKLNYLYTSYGVNADEDDKISADTSKYLQTAQQLKQMYQDHLNQSYLMVDDTLDLEEESEMDFWNETIEDIYGMSKDELFNSYSQNYIIVNENYLNELDDISLDTKSIDPDKYNIFVPVKYKDQETDLKSTYIDRINSLITYDNHYGDNKTSTLDESSLNIIYIEDNEYSVNLLSDLQYTSDSDVNTEIQSPIILIDNGTFGATYYMDSFSQCQLAFTCDSQDDFSLMLNQYGLGNLYFSQTMLAPFMSDIDYYQFAAEQGELFVVLFLITLLFLIYISNDVHVNVNSKRYALKYQLGYHKLRILRKDLMTTIILCLFSGVYIALHINITSYIFFVIFDFIVLNILYHKNITKNIFKIMNGAI